MAGSVNKVILVGNLGRDPEIRYTQDGRPIANLRLATTETWRDKSSGERREKTEWHSVVLFSEGLCKLAENYLKKGSKVYLEGQLQTRKCQDQSGQHRNSTEVVLKNNGGTLQMLDSRSGGGGGGAQMGGMHDDPQVGYDSGGRSGGRSGGGSAPRGDDRGAGYGGSNAFGSDLDDEIPF